jgi:hypothetical protein
VAQGSGIRRQRGLYRGTAVLWLLSTRRRLFAAHLKDAFVSILLDMH